MKHSTSSIILCFSLSPFARFQIAVGEWKPFHPVNVSHIRVCSHFQDLPVAHVRCVVFTESVTTADVDPHVLVIQDCSAWKHVARSLFFAGFSLSAALSVWCKMALLLALTVGCGSIVTLYSRNPRLNPWPNISHCRGLVTIVSSQESVLIRCNK